MVLLLFFYVNSFNSLIFLQLISRNITCFLILCFLKFLLSLVLTAVEFHSEASDIQYSGANWKVYEYCFMKQKCQIQMGIAQYKNAATPLRTKAINTTHQHFQMRYITLIYLKGLKSYLLK